MSFQPPLSGKEQDETEEFRPKFDKQGKKKKVKKK